MKRIFIPFFAAAALLASCSDWTEAEHKDFLPPMNQNDPAFLTSLRDFKVGEHLVTMMIVRGTSTAPNRQNQHPMSTTLSVRVPFFERTSAISSDSAGCRSSTSVMSR